MSGSARTRDSALMADAPRTWRGRSAWLARFLLLLTLSFAVGIRPALAQEILRDAETESLFRDMEKPIIAAAGLRPENVQIVLLQDRSINAFVAGGATVYVHNGPVRAPPKVDPG